MSVKIMIEQIRVAAGKCRDGKALIDPPMDLVNKLNPEKKYPVKIVAESYIQMADADSPNSYHILKFGTPESVEALKDAVVAISHMSPSNEKRKKPVVKEEESED